MEKKKIMKNKINTFGAKVLLVVVATVIITTIVIQFFTQRETEAVMSSAHNENALNL